MLSYVEASDIFISHYPDIRSGTLHSKRSTLIGLQSSKTPMWEASDYFVRADLLYI